MSEIPNDLRFADSHEWVRIDGDGTATIGISEHAQGLLGELVYVELPEIDAELNSGEDAGVVESVKAASDVYSPITGTVIETNEKLENSPDLVNSDPYGDGWLFRVQFEDEGEINSMMDPESYEHCIEAHEE